jgi:thiosulfate reductase/polysulfide reductase chain A
LRPSFLEAKANGAKVVAFDPRLCITANMADEWWPIKPGTDLAVALAMIHVILNEILYNATYVGLNVNPGDIDKLTDHVNDEGYTPEWAEGISGIPAADIERIAREFAGADHPIIPTYKRDAGGPVYANSASFGQAQMILNALVGAIEGTGGHYFTRGTSTPPSLSSFAPDKVVYPARDGTIRVDGQHEFPVINTMFSGGKKSKGNMSHLAEGLERARLEDPFPGGTSSYPVKVIISHKYNPTTIPQMDHFISEICQPDIFMAAIDSIPNSMCWFADVILPEPWWCEGKGFGTTSQHCLWPRLYLKDGIGALFSRKGGGSIYNGILQNLWPGSFDVDWSGLKNARMAQFAADHGMGSTSDDLKTWLNANNGIWQDKVYPPTPKLPSHDKMLGTTSGYIELYSQHFFAKGHEPMPMWHPKLVEPADEDEFYLITHHNPYNRMYKNCNDPLISDLQPENLLHMHPDAAAQFAP